MSIVSKPDHGVKIVFNGIASERLQLFFDDIEAQINDLLAAIAASSSSGDTGGNGSNGGGGTTPPDTGNPTVDQTVYLTTWNQNAIINADLRENAIVMVKDGTDGPNRWPAFSDGTNWKRVSDNTIITNNPVSYYSSPLTTKGDINIYSTADTRLGVGSDDQVLTADSSETTGLSWKTPFSSPLTSKGDLHTYSTADVSLSAGTNGQVLSSDSTATTGLKWITPSSYSSPVTTKGDINVYGTSDTRLPVGTNGQILTPDSSETLGLKWTTPTVTKYIVTQINANDTDLATGTGLVSIPMPWAADLIEVHAEVATAGTTGVTTFDINKNATSMLSTKLTIDSGEYASDTAATAAVIASSTKSVSKYDTISIDVDGVSTTAPKGGTILMGFELS